MDFTSILFTTALPQLISCSLCIATDDEIGLLDNKYLKCKSLSPGENASASKIKCTFIFLNDDIGLTQRTLIKY